MANKKISELAAANPIGVGDLFEIMQGGVNKKVNGARILDFVASEEASSTVLDVETTSVGNVGAGEDVLYTYTLPGDTLSVNGQGLRIRISGEFAVNGNTKELKVKFGSTDLVAFAGTVTLEWVVDCELIRTGASTQKCNCMVIGAGITSHATFQEPTETLSGDVVIEVIGEGTSNDDILKHTATVSIMSGSSGGGGGDINAADFVTETPSGTVDGVNDEFTVSTTPFAFFHFYVGGILQKGSGVDYTLVGNTVTLVIPPELGSVLSASYIK